MLSPRFLHIVTAVSNPLLWNSRIRLAEEAIENWLSQNNIRIILVECAYGQRKHQLEHLAMKLVKYVPVRAKTLLWTKENLLNIGIQQLPENAHYIATLDADIIWRKPNWTDDIVNALDLYPVVQPWKYAYDLAPNNEHYAVHRSFGSLNAEGKHVIPRFDEKTWQLVNYPYEYPHPGYAWGWTRPFLEHVGGLFEYGGVGSGDHHMALALVNNVHMSVPTSVNSSYKSLLMNWQARAQSFNGLKLGYTNHTIEHFFHGRKHDRAYNNRWEMFVKYNFDPVTDVKRNTFGVLEFAGNKPRLEKEWDQYMRARNEDINSLQ